MFLFLDFDGVLHPFPLGPLDEPFSAAQALWKILENFPDIEVVITSTWRETHTFPELLSLLASHGGERFIKRFTGVTPVLENATDYVPDIRRREIEAWLNSHASLRSPYLIIDDIEEYFDSTCSNLYLVDGSTGLTMNDVETIAVRLQNLASLMQHLVIAFQHRIEDIIPYCKLIEQLRQELEEKGLGCYIGDDMAIDGGDAEAIFSSSDVKKLFAFVSASLQSLPFMSGAKATLVFGALDSGAEEVTVYLGQRPAD